MNRLAGLFRSGEIDPEARNRALLIAGMVGVVVFALGLIAFGYYVDRIAPRGDTVFTVGDRKFSYAYLEDRIDAANAEGQFNVSNISFGIAQMVSDIQNEELVRRIAGEDGLSISDEELELGMRIDIGVASEADRNVFAAALRSRLQLLGLSLDRYEEIIEAELLQDKLVAQIEAGLPSEVEQAELSLIVVETDAAAATARQRIVDGEDFGEVAAEVSQHSSASGGGALGWTPAALLIDELVEPVFALEPGSLSDVIDTERGFYIVKVDGKEVRALDDATAASVARSEFGKRLETASQQYVLLNFVTIGQAQRIADHIQIQVSGG